MVSRGVGYGGLPLRLFAPADLIAATITWKVSGGTAPLPS